MRCVELLGFDEILAGLWRAAAGQRLAHALLFRGRAGIGKFQALEVLARGLLCAHGPAAPCEGCGPCKRVLAGAHPDLFVLDPLAEGLEHIPVAAIAPRSKESESWKKASVAEFLSLRAHEGGWKIVLVRAAERMNESAQNAFLKTLEEPTPRTLLALETNAPEALLTTVRSRVIEVRCPELARPQVDRILERQGLAAAERTALAELAHGSPGLALDLHAAGAAAVPTWFEAVEQGGASAVEAVAALCELPGDLPGRTPLARLRARVRQVLDLLLERARSRLEGRAGGSPPYPRSAVQGWLQARLDVDCNLAPEATLLRALLLLEPREGAAATTISQGKILR